MESRKTLIRAKVEHPFLYLKRHFGYAKVRPNQRYERRYALAELF